MYILLSNWLKKDKNHKTKTKELLVSPEKIHLLESTSNVYYDLLAR